MQFVVIKGTDSGRCMWWVVEQHTRQNRSWNVLGSVATEGSQLTCCACKPSRTEDEEDFSKRTYIAG